jgi:hypothetical protein
VSVGKIPTPISPARFVCAVFYISQPTVFLRSSSLPADYITQKQRRVAEVAAEALWTAVAKSQDSDENKKMARTPAQVALPLIALLLLLPGNTILFLLLMHITCLFGVF